MLSELWFTMMVSQIVGSTHWLDGTCCAGADEAERQTLDADATA